MRPDQQNGHDRAVRHLHRPGPRGLYVSACGTGKTLVGIRLAGTPGSQLTLVVVPTLDLIAQTALAWRKDGRAEGWWRCVRWTPGPTRAWPRRRLAPPATPPAWPRRCRRSPLGSWTR
ncbi:DEAD/DEAH box helicase family protein [Streptomyces sp. NPDC048417]|uniref:DEAD/DEAH box helicase family protein n=1 Tax=Streptomyces sp. NPDC048417 TaxID=3155387 RepID=UPI0034270E9E